MIAYLRGILTWKSPLMIHLESAGVGYAVHIPLSTYDHLPGLNEELKLQIHYSFNEMDGVRLFGFLTVAEKELFRNLISISKVGPKIALSILSGLSVQDFVLAVQRNDTSLLSTIPGIGRKSAERLIIELKDKLVDLNPDSDLKQKGLLPDDLMAEAESALLTLGYRQVDISKTLSALCREKEYSGSQELVKEAIKFLYRKKNI
ncbi:MAG: Holliday junction branch migration protein RuvA [Candidatus Cloacimonetes bacterium]|nr:Holliday junction branch migration protein RuvA [Candidatus Cloacimonadota bacterium]